jgi:tRNA threonylcarbamoyladenosine biosynthesis protein TsaB
VAGRLILAIDNSLNLLNIALAREEELIEERHIRPDKPPSQTIPGAVLQILTDHDCLVEDLSLIVVTLGPGSFTGIRVGLAFCKGLASGKKIPLIGVPTLDVLASPFSFLEGRYLCPLIDAKKGEVFLALYGVYHGSIERLTDYRALKPADVPAILQTPCLCFGTGVKLCADILSPIDGVLLLKEEFSRISGEMLVREGLRLEAKGTGHDLKPIYGRSSEAEIKFGVKAI